MGDGSSATTPTTSATFSAPTPLGEPRSQAGAGQTEYEYDVYALQETYLPLTKLADTEHTLQKKGFSAVFTAARARSGRLRARLKHHPQRPRRARHLQHVRLDASHPAPARLSAHHLHPPRPVTRHQQQRPPPASPPPPSDQYAGKPWDRKDGTTTRHDAQPQRPRPRHRYQRRQHHDNMPGVEPTPRKKTTHPPTTTSTPSRTSATCMTRRYTHIMRRKLKGPTPASWTTPPTPII